MSDASAKRAFARLCNLADERERKRTENVERATAALDPVTRTNIMEAARKDSSYVESSLREMLAGMVAAAIRRAGREVRTLPRLRLFAVGPAAEIAPRRREHVPGEYLDGAKESYADLIEELDRIVKVVGKKASKDAN